MHFFIKFLSSIQSKPLILLAGSSLLLSLASTKDLLLTGSLLSSLLSAWLFNLLGKTVSDKTVAGLKLLHVFWRVVDETKANGSATTKLGLETENRDSVLFRLVQACKLFTESILGNTGQTWVKNIDDELTTTQKGVANKLSGANSNGFTLKTIIRVSK